MSSLFPKNISYRTIKQIFRLVKVAYPIVLDTWKNKIVPLVSFTVCMLVFSM